MTEPAVTAVVVCLDEERVIGRCLDALRRQDLAEPYRILVVDGGSGDGTRTIVASLAAEDSRIALLYNPGRRISFGRNVGWREAGTALVAYTDADCVVPPHWLRTLVGAMRSGREADPLLVAVGGGNEPPDDTVFYRALRLMLLSYFGNRGSVQGKVFATERAVDHLPTLNVLYARKAIEAAGGFDETLFCNVAEDADISIRLRQLGGHLCYVPDCVVVHHQRATLRSWSRNMRLWGWGRCHLLRRHGQAAGGAVLLPLLAPLALLLAVAAPVWPWLAAPLAAYLGLFVVHAVQLAVGRGRLFLAPLVFILFVTTHFSYAVGLLACWMGRGRGGSKE